MLHERGLAHGLGTRRERYVTTRINNPTGRRKVQFQLTRRRRRRRRFGGSFRQQYTDRSTGFVSPLFRSPHFSRRPSLFTILLYVILISGFFSFHTSSAYLYFDAFTRES